MATFILVACRLVSSVSNDQQCCNPGNFLERHCGLRTANPVQVQGARHTRVISSARLRRLLFPDSHKSKDEEVIFR